uniref:Endonuclease/exonuclease/phosphatase domain-containing protein n=1 Tax=Chaetoceros debilis TaxID=122233 RepID=A0A7S3QC25_9STRA
MQNRRIFICLTHLAASGFRPTFVSAFSPTLTSTSTSIALNSNSNLPIQAKIRTRLFSTGSGASNNSIMSPATTTTTQSTKPSVRVVSYNILSSELAEPDYHTLCTPEDLDTSIRLPRILGKLQSELDRAQENDEKVVFCLQEVSHEFATALHVFFAERGYHFITALYGRKFNGFMGIGTAIPTASFELQTVDIVKLADERKGGWPRAPREPEPGILQRYVVSPIMNPVTAAYQYLRGPQRKQDDAWDYSKYRHNQFIGCKLQSRDCVDSPFWIGNYHMPCAFRTPSVMNIHADLVGNRIQHLAGDAPYILAGDFNAQPGQNPYEFLRTGVVDESDETYPPEKYGMKWESSMKSMRSAYFEMNKEEPEYTNASHNGAMNSESFIGTLDYIFLSQQWNVNNVLALPKRKDLVGVYPNANEPSDHLMIAASLELQ